ncbi:hypothetical protein V6N11_001232 [Hibiscus sabdariffa]|uniref:Uncharacterized protein n=1 Tax=Hibiscus sabdariffa TaxID=183260 RepID=A0ABR2RZE2_9ROSI
MFPSGKSVIEMEPQLDDILKCPGRGLIVSAVAPPDSEFDFISRFFCPKYGLNEDPVCGGAHCALAPYWSQKLGKHHLEVNSEDPFKRAEAESLSARKSCYGDGRLCFGIDLELNFYSAYPNDCEIPFGGVLDSAKDVRFVGVIESTTSSSSQAAER